MATTDNSNIPWVTIGPQDTERIQTGSTMAVAAYGDTPPGGQWVPLNNPRLETIGSSSGFNARVYANPDTRQIFVGVAGTNDLGDFLAYPNAYLGWSTNTQQLKDALQFGAELKNFVARSSDYSGYTIAISGHSWGELQAQMLSYAFGWSGVGFDGINAGAVVNSQGFLDTMAELGETVVGGTDFISCNTAVFLSLFGGGRIGDLGIDIPGTQECTVNSPWGFVSGVGTFIATVAAENPLLAFGVGSLASSLGVHSMKYIIDPAIQNGDFTVDPVVPPAAQPFSINDDQGNTLQCRVDESGQLIYSAQAAMEDGSSLQMDFATTGEFLSLTNSSTPTSGPTTDFFTITTNLDLNAGQTAGAGRTLLNHGIYAVEGVPGINDDFGIIQAANAILTDDWRPGAGEVLHFGSWDESVSIYDAFQQNYPDAIPDYAYLVGAFTNQQASDFDTWGDGSSYYEAFQENYAYTLDDVSTLQSFDNSSWGIDNYFATEDLSFSDAVSPYITDYTQDYQPYYDDSFVSWSFTDSFFSWFDPLVLDLDNNGVRLASFAEAPVLFDIDHDGDGSREIPGGWVSGGDGIVVMDLDHDGQIEGMHETMSEYFGGAAGVGGEAGHRLYANGFEALRSLDSNHDNTFTSDDGADTWASVQVWRDADQDGVSDSGELRSLAELGITSINLAYTSESGMVNNGSEVLASGTFTRNGQTMAAQAVGFLADSRGSSFGNDIVTSQNGQKTYVSGVATGEAIDVASLGVNNACGNSGNDSLIGDANANWLIGGQGSDTFEGGAGFDMLIIDAQDRQENIHAGEGGDMVQVVGDKGVVFNLAEVEVAVGGRGGDVLIGGGGSSVFIRGGDGADFVIGSAASDALSGENDDDLIDGMHEAMSEYFGGAECDCADDSRLSRAA